MKKYKLNLAEHRVAVLPDKKEEQITGGGIIIPLTNEENMPETGIIVEVGPGDVDTPMKYKKGDHIIFSQYAGLALKFNLAEHGDNTYKIMNQVDIIGHLEIVE